jgi:hypothetical protein
MSGATLGEGPRRFLPQETSNLAEAVAEGNQDIVKAHDSHELVVRIDYWQPTELAAVHERYRRSNTGILPNSHWVSGHHVADQCPTRIALLGNHALDQVPVGDDSNGASRSIGHQERTDASLVHTLGCTPNGFAHLGQVHLRRTNTSN